MPKDKKISAVIVTFNSQKTIKECIDSILTLNPGVEIIVFDNNSSDKTCSVVKSFGKNVVLIESDDNLGFGKGNNRAAKAASGDYLIFLNPDTKLVTPRGFDILVKTLRNNKSFGLVGPKLLYPDGKTRKTVRNLPTVFGAFEEYILGRKGAYDFYTPDCSSLCEVESIVGACMAIKKDLFDKVGGFDERYFLYYEDLQLCKDVRNLLRLKVGYLPSVSLEHIEGVSGKGQKTLNYLKTSAKIYHGLLQYHLLQLILRIGNNLHAS